MENKTVGAFGTGMLATLIVGALILQEIAPEIRIPKLVFIGVVLAGGILGVVIKEFLEKPYEPKGQVNNRKKQPDESELRANKEQWQANLHHPDGETRAEAATNLAIVKDLDSVPQFITLLRDPDRMVRLRATEALAWVTGADFGEDETQWMAWWGENQPAKTTEN